MNRLLAAFAKDYFAITEEAVHAYFPIAQAILKGTYVPKAEVLAEDEFEDDNQEDNIPQDDEFTGRIAVMSITGVLMHYGGMCSYGAIDYANRIDGYRMDESISGLIIKGDGPGGQVQGTITLSESLKNFAAVKPLIILVDDGVIASALVWAFSPATEIYASNPICQVGSVGVMACFMDVRKAMEMNGIEEVVIYAPQSTDKNKDFTDALNGKTQAVKAKLKFICDNFISEVANSRGDKLTSEEWNTGKMFFAEDAQRIGLIDGIKNYTEVVARMQELIAQNQKSDMDLKRFPKVAALKDAATITAVELEAAQKEIDAYGITGVTLCLNSELEELSTKAEAKDDVATTITAKDAEIVQLKADKVALQAKVDAKPAKEVTAPVAAADVIPGTEAEPEYEKTSVDLEKERLAKEWS